MSYMLSLTLTVLQIDSFLYETILFKTTHHVTDSSLIKGNKVVAADAARPNTPIAFGTLSLDELKNSRRHVVKNSADREEIQLH
ncbi:hypothetical protein [Candidatus Manganitrophus noduliformans]|uniref:Uncharacterized protein n=1 Tax=Candidatus Manganitrophus noduliformans TaxID=2606439 RepID=A0A7X6DQE0_9BACT|nr:hypothetical protein [Candidatus Manganitrophus noduliformans]NKE71314.1 hypothetical protein [Candidatus Manganitrophus noduliformans]